MDVRTEAMEIRNTSSCGQRKRDDIDTNDDVVHNKTDETRQNKGNFPVYLIAEPAKIKVAVTVNLIT